MKAFTTFVLAALLSACAHQGLPKNEADSPERSPSNEVQFDCSCNQGLLCQTFERMILHGATPSGFEATFGDRELESSEKVRYFVVEGTLAGGSHRFDPVQTRLQNYSEAAPSLWVSDSLFRRFQGQVSTVRGPAGFFKCEKY